MRNRLKSLLALNFSLKRRRKKNVFANVFFTCQPISRVPWNDDGLYDDQHLNRGENSDENEVFMTVTKLKLITGIDHGQSQRVLCQVLLSPTKPKSVLQTLNLIVILVFFSGVTLCQMRGKLPSSSSFNFHKYLRRMTNPIVGCPGP